MQEAVVWLLTSPAKIETADNAKKRHSDAALPLKFLLHKLSLRETTEKDETSLRFSVSTENK